MPGRIRQTVRYVTASDGVRLACAESGAGMPLVKAATWLTHLEHDLDSPVWRHWMAFLTGHFRFVRYDERGCGMTDWDVRDLSLDRRVRDLETVIEAARVEDPFVCSVSRTGRRSPLRTPCGTRIALRVWCCTAVSRAARCAVATGMPSGPTRRLRCWPIPGAATIPRFDRFHVAVHSGRHRGTTTLVQRIVSENDVAGPGGNVACVHARRPT